LGAAALQRVRENSSKFADAIVFAAPVVQHEPHPTTIAEPKWKT
jgi:hypothetical protein